MITFSTAEGSAMRGRARKELPDREIVEAYKQGVSQVFLAQYFEVSVGTIRKRLFDAGVIGPGKGNAHRLPVSGPNSWLNALSEEQRLRIEQIVLTHEKWRQHLCYMMSHIGGPGFPARQRGTKGGTHRDPETHVLDVRTKDSHDDLYRGMPRASTPCMRSLDGGRTWQVFEPSDIEVRGKFKPRRQNYRKDAARELQSQGLLPGKEAA